MEKLNFKKLINELNNDEIIIKNELNEIIKINKIISIIVSILILLV